MCRLYNIEWPQGIRSRLKTNWSSLRTPNPLSNCCYCPISSIPMFYKSFLFQFVGPWCFLVKRCATIYQHMVSSNNCCFWKSASLSGPVVSTVCTSSTTNSALQKLLLLLFEEPDSSDSTFFGHPNSGFQFSFTTTSFVTQFNSFKLHFRCLDSLLIPEGPVTLSFTWHLLLFGFCVIS